MDYQQRIIELTEQNNNLTILCYELADKLTLQQLVSPDEYSNIRKQIEQLKDATINDNILLGNKLLNEIIVLKDSLNNYLATCMDDIIVNKKMKDAVELQKNLLNNGFIDKSNKLNEFIEENKIKKFKFNCTKHNKDEITDEFLLTMPYLEVLDLCCEKCNRYCTKFDITDASIQYLVNLTELDCEECDKITDAGIQYLINLTELNCEECDKITDAGIQHLVNLTVLDCRGCDKITDAGIQHLINLTELDCSSCYFITDAGIKHLVNITKLKCHRCDKITDVGIQNLVKLTKLYCYRCDKITDTGIKYLVNLMELDSWKCPNITDHMGQIIKNRYKKLN